MLFPEIPLFLHFLKACQSRTTSLISISICLTLYFIEPVGKASPIKIIERVSRVLKKKDSLVQANHFVGLVDLRLGEKVRGHGKTNIASNKCVFSCQIIFQSTSVVP